ncbi:hypothetical protein LWI29_038496 [Acer saccharum]|uniref:Uncharacterized protein n=1 Tax=Acer saccharum TaxID=4024 RepID=A0AA39TC25_ACESA|nr:hypothetical protein LWI29_038496 [Acer saccharum]
MESKCIKTNDHTMAIVGEVDSNGENDKIYPVLAAMSTHIRKVEALRDAIRKMKVVRDVNTKCTSNAPAGRHRVYGDCPMDIAWLRLQLFEVTEEAHWLLAELDVEEIFPLAPARRRTRISSLIRKKYTVTLDWR